MAYLRVAVALTATALLTGSVAAYPAPEAADGWSYCLVASNLTRPRGILFDTEGGLIVVDRGVGLVHYKLREQGDCFEVEETKTLVDDEDLNHGLAISEDGRTLYASTSDEVYSWPYDPTAISVTSSSRRTLVTNMDNGGHSTRTILLSKKSPGMIAVSRGSDGNIDDEAREESTGHSQLRAYNLTELAEDDDPYDYMDGIMLGWGLRNSVGVAEHPETGGIWSVENSVDQLRRNGRDIHVDNPGEELNFHGYLNGSTEDQGGNYGYPQCVTVWSTENFPDQGDLETGDQFPLDSGSDEITILSDQVCSSDYVAPVLAFQAHTAPLDIKFNENGTTAYISFHGSWNRDEPIGYEISAVSFQNGRPTAPSNSMDAATPILSNADVSNCPGDCFRPVGLAWDSNGHLWFSSDSTGEIYVLRQEGGGGDNGGDDNNGDGNGSGDGNTGGGESGDDNDNAAATYLPGKSVLAVTVVAAVMGFFLA